MWGLRARILCSILTTMTHLSREHPPPLPVHPLFTSQPFSRLKCDLPAFYSKRFFVARHQRTRPPIHLGSKSVHLHMASFPFKTSTTLPNCFLSIHRTDQMRFTIVSDSTTNPLLLPNSSSYSPPPVNPAPSPPTQELPLLLLRLCDNNNNCVAVQRAFCWASARPAGTGNPLSLFHHLQPIPLCLGWRWSITGIKAAINVLSSRGHRRHSHAHSIFSLSAFIPLSHSILNPIQKRFHWQEKIIPLFFKMSPCLLFPPLAISLCAVPLIFHLYRLRVESQQNKVMTISVGGKVCCGALQEH